MAAFTYTIQDGDTLSGIAQQLCGDATLFTALAVINDIPNPDVIYTGNTLTIDCEAAAAWTAANERVGTPTYPGSGTTPAQRAPAGTLLTPPPPPVNSEVDQSALKPDDVSPIPDSIPHLPNT